MKKQIGFTLIELMIVVAIVAILAAVAWPSYQNQVRSSNRADAQGALLGLAQAMERHFTEKGTYAGAADGSKVPTIFPSESPLDGSNKTYNLRVEEADGDSYILQAIPKSGQDGDGILQVNSAGVKAWDRGSDGTFADPADMCWNKICS